MNKRLLSCFVAVMWLASSTAFGANVVTGSFEMIKNTAVTATAIWRYEPNPEIYIFDFPTLRQQANTFNRMTHFAEQQANKLNGRVFSPSEMAAYLGSIKQTELGFARGHDVTVKDLALFFNAAERDKLAISTEEAAVRDFLVSEGLIREWLGIYQAIKPSAVILGVPQRQIKHDDEPAITDVERNTILRHELSHGEFYNNPYYSAFVRKFWNDSLTEEQRVAFVDFLNARNYATDNPNILLGEFQAYLMHTPHTGAFSAVKLGLPEEMLKAIRSDFSKNAPATKLPKP